LGHALDAFRRDRRRLGNPLLGHLWFWFFHAALRLYQLGSIQNALLLLMSHGIVLKVGDFVRDKSGGSAGPIRGRGGRFVDQFGAGCGNDALRGGVLLEIDALFHLRALFLQNACKFVIANLLGRNQIRGRQVSRGRELRGLALLLGLELHRASHHSGTDADLVLDTLSVALRLYQHQKTIQPKFHFIET
jgi:hypothetical protein